MATLPVTQSPEQEQKHPEGALAPKVGPPIYGQNNAELPEDLQAALKDLVRKFGKDEIYARRVEVKEARKARFYWRGMQHLLWNNDAQTWVPAPSIGLAQDDSASDMPRFMTVTNIYQAYGRSQMAVLSQQPPQVRFEPVSPKEPRDMQAADAANDMARVIDKNNNIDQLSIDITRLLWTDGRVVTVTDYVTDGQRFGFEDSDQVQEAPEGIGTQEGTPGQENPPRTRVPKGQEVITPYGILEAKCPIAMRDIHDWPYCQVSVEHHISTMRAAYPAKADKISSSGNTGQDEYDRIARMSTMQGTQLLAQAGDNSAHMVTWERTWLRPSAFYEYAGNDTTKRDRLLALFPDGCYVVFVGDTYCESRNVSMDDHIAVLHALPGDGQHTPSLGQACMPLQDMLNDAINIRLETYEYGIPATWVDSEAVDLEALNEQTAQPGSHYPAKRNGAQTPLSDCFFQEEAASVGADLVQFIEDVRGPIAQFVTGAQPALFGGSMEDQKTASGYAMARDQAMGQIGLIWRAMKKHRARYMLQAVNCAKNRTEDVETMLGEDSGEPEVLKVSIEDLRDGNILAYPETDENFPESWNQKRQVYMTLLEQSVQLEPLQEILVQPDNLQLAKQLIGLTDLVIPQADSQRKQLQEIAEMLETAPVPDPAKIEQAVMGAGAAQMMGAPEQPMTPEAVLTSSVPIDPEYDDHATEFEECKRWINSPEGQKAKVQNPEGFMNVRLHGLAHQQVMQQAMQAQMLMQAAAQPPQEPAGKEAPPNA